MPSNNSPLTKEEKELLQMALGELKARGLSTSELTKKTQDEDWGTDPNGFFIRRDGKRFTTDNMPQMNFINSKAPFSAFFDSRGGGKSSAGAQKALRKIKQGLSGSVINPDFENFKLSTWSELREWIPWNMVVPSQRLRARPEWDASRPFTIVFLNGAKMYCKGLKDPSSARGANVNWLWYDEGRRDATGMGWNIAIASVRIGENTQRWTTTTPASMDSWLYKFFVKQEISDEVRKALEGSLTDPNVPFIDVFWGKLKDNEKNLDPIFLASLIATYEHIPWLRKQELEGEFASEGGMLGNAQWFTGKVLSIPPEKPDRVVRYWDLAASEKKISKRKSDDPDSTCGTKVMAEGGRFVICDQMNFQMLWHDIKKLIVDTALQDGINTEIWIEQEPGSGGKNQVAEIAGLPELAGYTVKPQNPRDFGDKVMRAQAWFAKAAQGLVYYVFGTWNSEFMSQFTNFPQAMHDDRIDSVSGAFFALSGKKNWKDIPFLKL